MRSVPVCVTTVRKNNVSTSNEILLQHRPMRFYYNTKPIYAHVLQDITIVKENQCI